MQRGASATTKNEQVLSARVTDARPSMIPLVTLRAHVVELVTQYLVHLLET
jgi:hypothetical protein